MRTNANINYDELTAFSYNSKYQIFFFSRSPGQEPEFLLRMKKKVEKFSNFSGESTSTDYGIVFALAKKFIKKTAGILSLQNIKHFLDTTTEFDLSNIELETKLPKLKQQRAFTPAVDSICKMVCETPYIYQDSKGEVIYFIEIPKLNLSRLNEYLAKVQPQRNFKYFTFDEIMDSSNGKVDSKLQEKLLESHSLKNYIKKFIIEAATVEIEDEYAVLCCEPSIYTHLQHSLLYPMFKKHGEKWTFYKTFEEELPTRESLAKLRGVIIPGSSQSVISLSLYSKWYPKVEEFICNLHNNYPDIRILGMCFGAQAIAHALGGKVDKNNSEKYIQAKEVLEMTDDFYNLPYVKELEGINRDKKLVIAQSHGDSIVELPTVAKKVGYSKTAEIEVFAVGDNILAFQGHPDLNEGWAKNSVPKTNTKILNDDSNLGGEGTSDDSPLTHKEISMICFSFLKQKKLN